MFDSWLPPLEKGKEGIIITYNNNNLYLNHRYSGIKVFLKIFFKKYRSIKFKSIGTKVFVRFHVKLVAAIYTCSVIPYARVIPASLFCYTAHHPIYI